MAADTLKFVAQTLGNPAALERVNKNKESLGSSATSIAESSASPLKWLGDDVAVQAQIQEWMLWSMTEINSLHDDKLRQVNEYLATRTFLVGSSLTLADLVVFGVTNPATTKFPVAQHLHFANLLRWADLVQAMVGEQNVKSTLPAGPLKLSKPAFVPPPPPPPAPPKAATAAPANQVGPADTGKKAAAGSQESGKAQAPVPAQAGKKAAAAAGGEEKGKGKEGEKAAAAAAEKETKRKEKKEGGGGGGGKKEEEEARIDMLDIKVGQIVKVGKHPNADALYLEEIDVGEEKPRQVISGLVKFVPVEEMQDRRVVVICNLKPAKMRDYMSYGMVLCASSDAHDKVVPIIPPDGVPVGERVVVSGFDQAPIEEVNPKKKIMERLFPDMRTNQDGVPCYKGLPFMTSKGSISSPIPDANVA